MNEKPGRIMEQNMNDLDLGALRQSLLDDRRHEVLMNDSVYGSLARLAQERLKQLESFADRGASLTFMERLRNTENLLRLRRDILLNRLTGPHYLVTDKASEFAVALSGVRDRDIFVLGFCPSEIKDIRQPIAQANTGNVEYLIVNPAEGGSMMQLLFDRWQDIESRFMHEKGPVILTRSEDLDTSLAAKTLGIKSGAASALMERVKPWIELESEAEGNPVLRSKLDGLRKAVSKAKNTADLDRLFSSAD
jgi:hypothetical protein